MNHRMEYPVGSVFKIGPRYFEVCSGDTGLKHWIVESRCDDCAFREHNDLCENFNCTHGSRNDSNDVKAIPISKEQAVLKLLTIK